VVYFACGKFLASSIVDIEIEPSLLEKTWSVAIGTYFGIHTSNLFTPYLIDSLIAWLTSQTARQGLDKLCRIFMQSNTTCTAVPLTLPAVHDELRQEQYQYQSSCG
jgi:hypothetical protein